MNCIGHKTVVALFVKDLLQSLKHDCVWTMNIQSGVKSGDCSAIFVIDGSSEDIVKAVAANYSGALTFTWTENIQAG